MIVLGIGPIAVFLAVAYIVTVAGFGVWLVRELGVPSVLVVLSGSLLVVVGLGAATAGITFGTHRIHRWATGTQFRAGLVTGLVTALLIPLAGLCASAFAQAEPSPLPRGAPVATASPTASQPLDFDACLLQLQGPEAEKARAVIERGYRVSPNDSEDIVREAMIRICLRHGVSPYPNLPAALMRAAHNEAKDELRRYRRTVCGTDTTVPSCDATPDEVAMDLQEARVLAAAMCQLPARQRTILDLHFHEDLQYREIAARLGMTEQQAKDEGTNAIKQLRKVVRDRCGR